MKKQIFIIAFVIFNATILKAQKNDTWVGLYSYPFDDLGEIGISFENDGIYKINLEGGIGTNIWTYKGFYQSRALNYYLGVNIELFTKNKLELVSTFRYRVHVKKLIGPKTKTTEHGFEIPLQLNYHLSPKAKIGIGLGLHSTYRVVTGRTAVCCYKWNEGINGQFRISIMYNLIEAKPK